MNWVNAAKGKTQVSCPFEYAAHLTEVMLLGIVSPCAPARRSTTTRRTCASPTRPRPTSSSGASTGKAGRSRSDAHREPPALAPLRPRAEPRSSALSLWRWRQNGHGRGAWRLLSCDNARRGREHTRRPHAAGAGRVGRRRRGLGGRRVEGGAGGARPHPGAACRLGDRGPAPDAAALARAHRGHARAGRVGAPHAARDPRARRLRRRLPRAGSPARPRRRAQADLGSRLAPSRGPGRRRGPAARHASGIAASSPCTGRRARTATSGSGWSSSRARRSKSSCRSRGASARARPRSSASRSARRSRPCTRRACCIATSRRRT